MYICNKNEYKNLFNKKKLKHIQKNVTFEKNYLQGRLSRAAVMFSYNSIAAFR